MRQRQVVQEGAAGHVWGLKGARSRRGCSVLRACHCARVTNGNNDFGAAINPYMEIERFSIPAVGSENPGRWRSIESYRDTWHHKAGVTDRANGVTNEHSTKQCGAGHPT